MSTTFLGPREGVLKLFADLSKDTSLNQVALLEKEGDEGVMVGKRVKHTAADYNYSGGEKSVTTRW